MNTGGSTPSEMAGSCAGEVMSPTSSGSLQAPPPDDEPEDDEELEDEDDEDDELVPPEEEDEEDEDEEDEEVSSRSPPSRESSSMSGSPLLQAPDSPLTMTATTLAERAARKARMRMLRA